MFRSVCQAVFQKNRKKSDFPGFLKKAGRKRLAECYETCYNKIDYCMEGVFWRFSVNESKLGVFSYGKNESSRFVWRRFQRT
jgi:hypothetical protein